MSSPGETPAKWEALADALRAMPPGVFHVVSSTYHPQRLVAYTFSDRVRWEITRQSACVKAEGTLHEHLYEIQLVHPLFKVLVWVYSPKRVPIDWEFHPVKIRDALVTAVEFLKAGRRVGKNYCSVWMDTLEIE